VVPIVLLTARASRDSRVSGLRDGADDYVAKPVDLEELFVRLDNLVSARRRVTARFADVVRLPAISVPLAHPPRDDEDQRLLNALTVALAEHLDDEHFTADALAQSLGLSRSAMYRRLQPLLGRSPIDAVWGVPSAAGRAVARRDRHHGQRDCLRRGLQDRTTLLGAISRTVRGNAVAVSGGAGEREGTDMTPSACLRPHTSPIAQHAPHGATLHPHPLRSTRRQSATVVPGVTHIDRNHCVVVA
jgi:CheY-like chemotaxis protein